ncbi:MAG TPA: LysR family transcriptional regulator [Burkholderiaceae bacterium]|jgi:DNA-binding transcriptional LysR family regulator|nr:LysR family transcriptional regulator [Burkholderiaceae bacterium]
MLPDLDSLALFVRAAELRSLTKAADASHICLAAASRRITLLEHRFKAALLERSPRGVEPTAAGTALLAHARTLLLHVNQMQADMRDHACGRRGALRLLANTSAMTQFLPSDLARFGQRHPDVRVIVQERWSDEIVKAVHAAEADLGIVIEGQRMDGLEVLPYRCDRLAVVLPAAHPLADAQPLRFADVLEYDIVALEGGSSMMRLLAAQAAVTDRTLNLRVQVRSFEAVCRMVQAGIGIGLLPQQAAAEFAHGMGLAVRPLPEPWAERRMLICARRERAGNGALEALLRHLAADAPA